MRIQISQVKLLPASLDVVADYQNSGLSEIDWGDILKHPSSYRVFRMMYGRTPLSLIAVSVRSPYNEMSDHLYVDRIEKMPKAEAIPGIGVLSLIKLIMLSKKYRCGGKLLLDATRNSQAFYKKVGMEEIGIRTFRFTPRIANRFTQWATNYLSTKGYVQNPTIEDGKILYGDFNIGPRRG